MIYYNNQEYTDALKSERDALLGIKSKPIEKEVVSDSPTFDPFVMNKDLMIVKDDPLEEPILSEEEKEQKEEQKSTYKDKEEKDAKEKLVEPINFTDPIIYHDPIEKITEPKVVKKYQPQHSNEDKPDENPSPVKTETDKTKTDGVMVPIIKLNNLIIDDSSIKYMDIKYDSLFPTLNLEVIDHGKMIQFKDVPGQNNVITVILLASKDGVYKKISLDFTITSYEPNGDFILYDGVYKLLTMNQSKFEGLLYQPCQSPNCNHEQQIKPNTWETLHDIARNAGLGFASTDKCKSVNDRMPRLLQNINYYDYIEYIMPYSGLDMDSMFDCWIDLYGYLVLINVSWVMNEKVEYNNLSIISTVGVAPTSDNTPEQDSQEVIRSLTNYNSTGGVTDLSIATYEPIANPGDLYYNGSLKTYTIFHPEGVDGKTNNISQEQIQIVENSIDGKHTEDYEITELLPIYFEFNDYDVYQQRERRTAYFTKLRANKLKVMMKRMNFGLQRGTLINVDIFEYDSGKKSVILTSSSNLYNENTEVKNDINTQNEDARNIINGEGIGLINPALSGIYYIDGMEFEYKESEMGLIQILYLIKKGGDVTSFANKYTMGKALNK